MPLSQPGDPGPAVPGAGGCCVGDGLGAGAVHRAGTEDLQVLRRSGTDPRPGRRTRRLPRSQPVPGRPVRPRRPLSRRRWPAASLAASGRPAPRASAARTAPPAGTQGTPRSPDSASWTVCGHWRRRRPGVLSGLSNGVQRGPSDRPGVGSPVDPAPGSAPNRRVRAGEQAGYPPFPAALNSKSFHRNTLSGGY